MTPQIWVFTNHRPELQFLSMDRWILHSIKDTPDGRILHTHDKQSFSDLD